MWNVVKPIGEHPKFKKLAKGAKKVTNTTKHAAKSGYKKIATLYKHSANQTVGAWRYVAPKID